jgi:hypothetical protein
MNTSVIHRAQGSRSRLPIVSLAVATAAAGLAMASLAVAVNDDGTTPLPEIVPAEQDGDQAPATPRIQARGDGCYETAIGSVLC